MIKTIVNEYHWSPSTIDEMFLDGLDHHGLIYWYEAVVEMHERLKKK